MSETSSGLAGRQYVLYIGSVSPEVDLEPRKIYTLADGESGDPDGWLRVIDESGEDYLYPSEWFVPIEVPAEAAAAFEQ